MNIMVTSMTLEKLEGTKTRRYYMNSSGMKQKHSSKYLQLFVLYFKYLYQVDEHNN